jgi:TolB-like protein
MVKKPVTTILLAMVLCLPVMAQESRENGAPKRKIVIFQFRDVSRTTDFAYYTYIIPDSIALELRRKDSFSVQTYPVTLDYISDTDSADKRKDHVLYLSGRGKEFSADFIISGMYEVKNNRIKIRSQFFNVRQQKIAGIEETSDELGALIFLIIDNISERINTQLGKNAVAAGKAQEERPLQAEPPAKSPFLPVYNALRGTVLGVEHGRLYLTGSWGDIYRDTDHFGLNLQYGLGNLDSLKDTPIIRNSSLALNYHYLSSIPHNHSSSIMIRGTSLGGVYSYPVLGAFRLSAEAGIGMMFSTLRLYDPLTGPSSGPQQPIDEKKSQDIFTRLLVSADYELKPLVFKTGFSINRIWYSDEPMDFLSLVFSLGFRI